VDFAGDIDESAEASEEAASSFAFLSDIEEEVEAQEEADSDLIIGGAVEEAASIEDLGSSGSVDFGVSVEEEARVFESALAAAVFIGRVLITVKATDAVISRLLWELINDSQPVDWQNIGTSGGGSWQIVNTSEETDWKVIKTSD